jgi:TrwC relaxase
LVHNDYHSKNKRVLGTWSGVGCELYAVKAGGPVDVDKEFGALKENKHAVKGGPLTRQKERRKAFADLTCSAPKTFSIAAMLGKAIRTSIYPPKACWPYVRRF